MIIGTLDTPWGGPFAKSWHPRRREVPGYDALVARVLEASLLDINEKRKAEAERARRQTDPEDKEFIDPKGAAVKGKGKRGSNTPALSESEKKSKPGTLRRLARTRPDLLERYEADDGVDAGKKAAKVMEGAPDEVGPGQGHRSDLASIAVSTPGPEIGEKGGRGHRSNRTKLKPGESATYLAARLKRDHPEIASRVLAGEFKNLPRADPVLP